MKNAENKITAVLKSSGFAWLLIIESFVMGWAAFFSGFCAENISVDGIWLPNFDSVASARDISIIFAVVIIGLCCIVMAVIGKMYNVLKTTAMLFVGLFSVMVSSTPELYVSLDTGVVLAFVILLCVALLYSTYLAPQQTRRIFLIYFLIACGILFDYSFLPFIFVFFIGMNQMRCFSLRTFLAAIIGLITPVWILWGFGLLNLHEFVIPDPLYVYKWFLAKEGFDTFICVGLAMVIGLILGVCNLMKTIAFNARNRAFTGVWSVMGIICGILCFIDFTNIWAYVPLLYICVAYQAALFMRLFEHYRSYIVILIILILYIGFFVWNLTV
ncbi:MAG: hypothetical protein K2H63_02915 [Paramuribaculum sp.]|nr:hypothetical protein [Paramuribaculum sp.]